VSLSEALSRIKVPLVNTVLVVVVVVVVVVVAAAAVAWVKANHSSLCLMLRNTCRVLRP
jgi:hypothetical protein